MKHQFKFIAYQTTQPIESFAHITRSTINKVTQTVTKANLHVILRVLENTLPEMVEKIESTKCLFKLPQTTISEKVI